MVIPSDVAATLRSLLVIDIAGERARVPGVHAEDGIVLVGDDEDVDELIGHLAWRRTTRRTGGE